MDTEFARQRMVQQQIRTWDVADQAVLDVIQQLDRGRFVPAGFAQLAYADTEIPLSPGQSMMKPIVEGRALQALELTSDDSVLEIGTGSGYLTACLARLAGQVSSIDINLEFVERARKLLQEVGIDNVTIDCLDAMKSLPDGLFDVIAVTGSVPQPEQRFVDALKPGGRMFVVVGDAPLMSAELVTRGDGGDWHSASLFETKLAPLINVRKTPGFLF
jgi:protein-L-isoaspartate(D-aspartate) O-methyltransferase